MATKEMVKKGETALATNDAARPEWLAKGDVRGTEHITRDDLKMPRLQLAQAMSYELDSNKPEYIEDLKQGEFFNDLTHEIYGKGPIEFTVVRADKPRFIEFYPRAEGGGIKDMNVPLNDPRTLFTKDENGLTVPPAATKFYDFILMLLPTRELIALSFKMTGLKAAAALNGLLKTRNAPTFAGKYVLTSGNKTNSKGTFKVHVIQNAGWLDKETFDFAQNVYDGLKDKEISINREAADAHEEGDPSFDPGSM